MNVEADPWIFRGAWRCQGFSWMSTKILESPPKSLPSILGMTPKIWTGRLWWNRWDTYTWTFPLALLAGLNKTAWRHRDFGYLRVFGTGKDIDSQGEKTTAFDEIACCLEELPHCFVSNPQKKQKLCDEVVAVAQQDLCKVERDVDRCKTPSSHQDVSTHQQHHVKELERFSC